MSQGYQSSLTGRIYETRAEMIESEANGWSVAVVSREKGKTWADTFGPFETQRKARAAADRLRGQIMATNEWARLVTIRVSPLWQPERTRFKGTR